MSQNDPHRYDDIIGLSRPRSRRHPPMPAENRAAQFSPFAAVSGYEAAIRETARLTDHKLALDDEQKLRLNARLQLVAERLQARPEITVTFFLPDARKDGGAYVTETAPARKLDATERTLLLASGRRVPIDDILALEGELFGSLGEEE